MKKEIVSLPCDKISLLVVVVVVVVVAAVVVVVVVLAPPGKTHEVRPETPFGN